MVQGRAELRYPALFLTNRYPEVGYGCQTAQESKPLVASGESNALDLEQGVFTGNSPKEIARSLRRSAEQSRRRKADPFRSAMSMLIFYMNV